MQSSEEYLEQLLAGTSQSNTVGDATEEYFSDMVFETKKDDANTHSVNASKANSSLLQQHRNEEALFDEKVTISQALENNKKMNTPDSENATSHRSIREEIQKQIARMEAKEEVQETPEDLDDIEALLKSAEEEGMRKAADAGLMGITLSEEAMDLTDFVDTRKVKEADAVAISELLKKSDHGIMVEKKEKPVQEDSVDSILSLMREDAFDLNAEESQEDSKEKRKKEPKEELGKEQKDELEENSKDKLEEDPKDQLEEELKKDLKEEPKEKQKRKKKEKKEKEDKKAAKNKKGKGLFWFKGKKKPEKDADDLDLAANSSEEAGLNAANVLSAVTGLNAANASSAENGLNASGAGNSKIENIELDAHDKEDASTSVAALFEELESSMNSAEQGTNIPNSPIAEESPTAENPLDTAMNVSTSVADLFGALEGAGDAGENSADVSGPVLFDEDGMVDSMSLSFDGESTEEPKKTKKNLFSKLFEILTKETEEEVLVPEQDETKLSSENFDILASVDKEIEAPAKKKKEKKPKKAKVKPAKAKKKPNKNVAMQIPEKKLPAKYVKRSMALALAIFLAMLLVTLYIPGLLVIKEGRSAYYQGDYETAFYTMFGKKLNESDQLIYERARLIVLLDRKLEAYENYAQLNMPKEALHSLLMGVARYKEMGEAGQELQIADQLASKNAEFLQALQQEYQIEPAKVDEVLQYSQLDYNHYLDSVIQGYTFVPAKEAIWEMYGLNTQSAFGSSEEVSQGVAGAGDAAASSEGNGERADLLPEELLYHSQNGADGQDATESGQTNGQTVIEGIGQTQTGEPVRVELDSELFQ